MPKAELANEIEIKEFLEYSPNWTRQGDSIIREITTANFPAATGVFNAIALLAEKADHHPDLLVYGWNKLRVTLSTHDAGGLTELDFSLAREIDNLGF